MQAKSHVLRHTLVSMISLIFTTRIRTTYCSTTTFIKGTVVHTYSPVHMVASKSKFFTHGHMPLSLQIYINPAYPNLEECPCRLRSRYFDIAIMNRYVESSSPPRIRSGFPGVRESLHIGMIDRFYSVPTLYMGYWVSLAGL